MTRANVIIVTTQGKFKFQANSSAYPSYFGKTMFNFIRHCATQNLGASPVNGIGFYEPESNILSELINDLGLSLGSVGNFDYVYEFDFVKRTFKVWESKLSWVNAPIDWRERGWNCWLGKNGKFGWSNWVKGKLIFNSTFYDMVEFNVKENMFGTNLVLLETFEKK
jgi:hypothetical protein